MSCPPGLGHWFRPLPTWFAAAVKTSGSAPWPKTLAVQPAGRRTGLVGLPKGPAADCDSRGGEPGAEKPANVVRREMMHRHGWRDAWLIDGTNCREYSCAAHHSSAPACHPGETPTLRTEPPLPPPQRGWATPGTCSAKQAVQWCLSRRHNCRPLHGQPLCLQTQSLSVLQATANTLQDAACSLIRGLRPYQSRQRAEVELMRVLLLVAL
jgi:hypothetical protein